MYNKIFTRPSFQLIGFFILAIITLLLGTIHISYADTSAVGTPNDVSVNIKPDSLAVSTQSVQTFSNNGLSVGVLAYCTDLTGSVGAQNTVNTLLADGRFGSVILVDGDDTLPTAEDLLSRFDVVIAMTDNRCGSSIPSNTAADALTSFVQGGGGAVITTFGFSNPNGIGFGDSIFGSNLSPFQQVRVSNASAGSIDVTNVSHTAICNALLDGVTSPISSQYANYVALSSGATLCASYTNGHQFLAVNAAENIVGLNTFPASSNDNTQSSYRRLISNAVFVASQEVSGNQAPTLSFVNEDGYVSDTESPGVEPNKGTANLTNFTFKVNYTSIENSPPIDLKLVLEHAEEDVFVPYKEILMFPSDNLDTNYIDGSEYYTSFSLPKNYYRYHFEVTDGINSAILPKDGGSFVLETAFSNVAFVPGMQASRLYRIQTYENQLWEPNRNGDIEKLYLSPETGESLDKTIYTRDLIKEPNVLPDPTGALESNIYKSFMDDMNDLVKDNTINEWKALPYDWRLDLHNILSSGIPSGDDEEPNIAYHYETQTPYILEQLQALVDSSDSGNVTLIAHSNGGLVVKYLLAKLEEGSEQPYSNYPDLLDHIDRVILVAAPQIGTPLAIEAMLHGDEQQLTIPMTDFGTLLDEERVRGLSEYMMTAYNLLPSKKYFDLVDTPVIEFGSDVDEVYDFQSIYGPSINTQAELTKFLLGDNGLREKPKSTDEDSPNVLEEHLLDRAISTHNNTLDSWVPPSHIQFIQIAGTGLKTVSGIKYDDCDIIFCPDKLSNLDREILKTTDGDGTVVEPSALVMEDEERTYIDIHDYNFGFNRNRDHASILEIDSLRTYIERLIQGQLEHDAASDLDYLSKTKPDRSGRKALDFEIHSPVALHIYDNIGNHTGIVPNTDPESDIRMYEKTVSNSYYTEMGKEKYAGVIGDNPVTVVLRGENDGVFTFVVKETKDDTVTQTKIFASIPVTADTIAAMETTTIDDVTELQVDIDGDGSVDASFEEGFDAIESNKVAFLKGYIPTLGLNDGNKNALLQKIENIERTQHNEKIPGQAKIKSINAFIHAFMQMVDAYEKTGYVSDSEAKLLTDAIVSLEK